MKRKGSEWLKQFSKRRNALIALGLIIVAMALVLAIRMLPTQLPITEQWAEQSIDNTLRQQLGAQVQQQFPHLPQDSRDRLLNEQVAQFKEQNLDQIKEARTRLEEQLKAGLRYEGEDGEQHTYLGDLDSYFWLRYTRNWLETGTACDEVVDGQCLDAYQLAPVGVPMDENPSLHVFAIGFLYKIITLFNENYPLPAASYLVPVLVGMLGVIPAFFIGRRLAGNVAGFFAAILIGVHPLVLSRSLGSDNDIWNVVLPLFLMWMTIEALEAKGWKSRAAFAALAGLFVGIHAATWPGWWFVYLIVFLGLLANLVFQSAKKAVRDRTYEVWTERAVQSAGLIVAVFYIASLAFTLLAGVSAQRYATIPLTLAAPGSDLDAAVGGNYWPNVLTTVAELNNANIAEAINSVGGKLFFAAALVGLILMLLPRKEWHWQHWAALGAGFAIALYLVNDPPASRLWVLVLLMLPIALILLFYLFREEDVKVADTIIVLVWFLATVFAAYNGVRFILLLIPAFGIAFGVLAGRAYEWVAQWAEKEFSWHKAITYTVLFLLFALVLIKPVQAGYETASGFIPSIDDGWWSALEKIRQESHEDAIINSWWDFGHWFKYVADRRVSADGTSQHTHVPRWLGLALVTSDEREAMGTLRMLDCGSDTYPQYGGLEGAYGKVFTITNDPLRSERIVRELLVLDEEGARKYLEREGFSSEEIANITASTHCDPPEDYFITSGDMVNKAGVWAHFGLWDFERAYIVQTSTGMPKAAAVEDLAERFGHAPEEAERLYLEAIRLRNEAERNAWIAPWPGYYAPNWIGCKESEGMLRCEVRLGIGQQGNQVTAIDRIVIDLDDPHNSTIGIGGYVNGQRTGGFENATPALLVVAGDSLEEYRFENTQTPNLGVVADVQNNRVLLADERLASSMFTQLFFLEGRYNDRFTLFDDRQTFSGSRIMTWKVDWDEAES